MKIKQILNCSFERWYPNFKNITIKSEIISIPDDVIAYLRSDDTRILPKSCQIDSPKTKKKDIYDSDSEFSSDEDETNENAKIFDFPEFDKDIKNALEELDGNSFIKLNWSSPKDAYWALNRLNCEFLRDVYILLNSSDFMSHDLNEPFSKCDENSKEDIDKATCEVKYKLIFRKWIDINPNSEFRCFVRDNNLIAISQRDCRTYHKWIEDNKDKIINLIKQFYAENICKKFFDDSFVFDIYIKKNDKVVLLDFNPYGQVTDSLLFDWDELNQVNLPNNDVVFRHVENDGKIQAHQYDMYQLPKDLIDIAGNSDPEKMIDLIRAQTELQNKEAHADSD